MNNFIVKFIRFILRYPVAVVAATGVVFLSAAAFLPGLKIDNSVDIFFNKTGARYLNFQEWKHQFGTDEVIIAALQADDMFTTENLGILDRLTRRLETVAFVDAVTSLTNVNTTIGKDQDFVIEYLVEEIPSDPDALTRLRDKALRDPLYVKNVISPDGRVAAILIELDAVHQDDDAWKKTVMEEVQSILRAEIPAHMAWHLSGLTAIEYFYASYMQEDFKAFMPFLLLMIVAVMYLCFRSAKLVVIALGAIMVSVAGSMAFLRVMGYSVNNVTTIIPPILMAIMIADSVHVMGEGQARRRAEGKDLFLQQTMAHLFLPCLLTTLTTAFGFLSLTLSTIPPIRQLGLVVGFGVFFSFVITFTCVPALAKLWGAFESTSTEESSASQEASRERFKRFLTWVAGINQRHYKKIIAAGIAAACVSAVGALQIKSETSVIEYFKKSTPIYKATVFIEDHLSGVHTLNVSLRALEDNHFYSPEALNRVEKMIEFLYGLPEVDKVMSVNDYMKQINQSFHNEDESFYSLPQTREMIAQYVLLYGRQDLEDFMDDQWRWATIRVRLKEHSTVKLEGVISRIEEYLRQFERADFHVQVVGQTALEVESNNAVTEGQLKSLGLAMLVIFGMMFIVFRSVPVGLVSMIPNILPILMNFGLMGFLGIRLDSATSMIAAIGIGIVVDDTIHFLHGFGEAMKKTSDYAQGVHMTLQDRGRPIIATSLILFFGFGILSVSRFVPTAYFGMLTALLMMNALIADLFILPSVLIWIKPPFQRSA